MVVRNFLLQNLHCFSAISVYSFLISWSLGASDGFAEVTVVFRLNASLLSVFEMKMIQEEVWGRKASKNNDAKEEEPR